MSDFLKTKPKTQLSIIWLGQAIVLIMLGLSLPYWPIYLSKLSDYTPNELRYWTTIIYVCPYIASIICAPLWGKVADHFDYKTIITLAFLGLCFTQFATLMTHNVLYIVFILLIQGSFTGFVPVLQAWSLDLSPSQLQSATIGKLQSATAIGTLIGPFLGGLIATYLNYSAIFYIGSIACFFVSIVFYLSLPSTKSLYRTNVSKEISKPPTQKNNVKKFIFIIMFTIIIVHLGHSILTPIFTLYITETLHWNEFQIGILYGIPSLFIFFSASRWGSVFDRKKSQNQNIEPIVIAILIFTGVLQILYAYILSTPLLFLIRILWGICLGALLPVFARMLIDRTNPVHKGFILGSASSATKFGNLLGVLVGASIEVTFGFTASFWVNGFIYFAGAGLMLIQLSFLKKENTQLQISFIENVDLQKTHS